MKILFSTILLLLVSCATQSQSTVPVSEDPPFLHSQEQFISWSSKPLYQKYGQVSSLKVVYDNRNEKLHFISSERFEYHYEYCMQVLHYPDDLAAFNKESYSGRDDRRFLLANINYYKALDKYALELGPSDRMSGEMLVKLFEKVKADVFFGENLYLMLNTMHVNSLWDEAPMPVVTPDEIYNGQIYQPIAKYRKYGKVHVIQDWEDEAESIRPTDIIVLNDIPEVFPLVAGVIVTQFQTPLSHVTLLGQNRKIPICAYSHAFDAESILKMDEMVVEFKVEQDTFLLTPADVELSEYWEAGKRIKLDISTKTDSLIPVQYLRERHSNTVGNKAANFGELNRFSDKIPFKVPESGFAIPFYFYEQHINRSGAKQLIEAFLEKDNRERSVVEIGKDLEEIQARIMNVEIDPELLKDVESMILRLGAFKRMRFRSSTNAEDMEGFSGAGIYTSKTGELGSYEKPVSKAIKEVWASLWSYSAFMERESYNMDHGTVAMGILVHRSFPDEAVNGVAITTNLYRDDYLGFVVNAQLGDVSVVQPDNKIRCDEFICYPDETTSMYGSEDSGIDIINYSSLNHGELVMTTEEIQQLANVLELIKRRYLRNHYIKTTYFNFGLDIEFKLDKENRQLYIKQMRVYNR